jgi:hypothetical protein
MTSPAVLLRPISPSTRAAVCVPFPGSRPAIDRNKASTSAVNVVAAIAWCSMDSRVSLSRSGDTDRATNSSPTRAPDTPALPAKKLV